MSIHFYCRVLKKKLKIMNKTKIIPYVRWLPVPTILRKKHLSPESERNLDVKSFYDHYTRGDHRIVNHLV